jgi:hypothetical protein
LSAPNGVTVSEVSPSQTGGAIPAIGKLIGTVQTVGSNQFTLQSLWGKTFTINVDSGTTYSTFPSSACSTAGFGCVQTGQVVQIMITFQSGGGLLASEVDYIQLPTQQTVEGNIIGLSTSGGNTVMDLIIQRQPSTANADVLPVGRHAKVTVPGTGVTYAIDSGSFTLPSGLTFASASDLQVGQTVLVVVQGTVSQPAASSTSSSNAHTLFGSPDVSFTASTITLEPTQITGTVASVTASSLEFTLATLPIFYVPPSATPGAMPSFAPVIITVQTTSATTFTNFTTDTIGGLAVNDVVSLHGWVFSTPSGATNVTVAADTVVDRPGPTPLF